MMFVLGLTGSIGMGKSTVAAMFEEEGVPVVDADKIVHELYERRDVIDEVEALFPGTCDEKQVNRQKLSRSLAGKKERVEALQELVHPLVAREKAERLSKYKSEGKRVVVVDVPLLFETGGDKNVDATLVVSCSRETQRKRVLERESMTEEKFEGIRKLQMDDDEKKKRATHVINTDCSREETTQAVKKILKSILSTLD